MRPRKQLQLPRKLVPYLLAPRRRRCCVARGMRPSLAPVQQIRIGSGPPFYSPDLTLMRSSSVILLRKKAPTPSHNFRNGFQYRHRSSIACRNSFVADDPHLALRRTVSRRGHIPGVLGVVSALSWTGHAAFPIRIRRDCSSLTTRPSPCSTACSSSTSRLVVLIINPLFPPRLPTLPGGRTARSAPAAFRCDRCCVRLPSDEISSSECTPSALSLP